MALITLVSANGAPGVSTTAIGLAMAWPRPVLLVEAAATGSALLPGLFTGRNTSPKDDEWARLTRNTVIEAAASQRYGQLLTNLPNHTIGLDQTGRVQCLLGYTDPPAQGRNLAGFWGPLAEAAQDLEGAGTDVLVDAGRAGALNEPTPLLQGAEALIIVTGSNTSASHGARTLAGRFRAEREPAGTADTLGVAVVGPNRPYSSGNVAERAIRLPLWFEIPWDPQNAAVYSDGDKPTKKFQDSAFARSMVTGAEQITRRIRDRRARLTQRISR
ncbi:hypothetical protein ACFV9C_41910 [Kribbella sp. NPDC059898]|uniref:hypothetical protein n=1 Tax=Kribbella sp. NPDC059898 TaxID=3346995 RepID=UPI00364D16C1